MVGEPQNSTSLHWIPLACFSATVRPAKVSLGSLRAVRIFRSHKERETREPLELQNVSNVLTLASLSHPEKKLCMTFKPHLT